VAECREFLAVGHERSALGIVGAVEAKDLVVGAGHQRLLGVVIRLVVLPDPDPCKADDRRLVVFRKRNADAAAFAVDAAAEADLAAFFGEDRVMT